MTTVFTIGHSRHAPGHFMRLLHANSITLLVDVRSHPVSMWAPHFGKDRLARLLVEHAVEYVFGRQLGGRPEGRQFYRQDGSVDYARRASAPDFVAGIEQLAVLARDRRTVILCAEEDPARCHRRRLVAPALRRAGLAIARIRGDAQLERDADHPAPPSQGDLFGGR